MRRRRSCRFSFGRFRSFRLVRLAGAGGFLQDVIIRLILRLGVLRLSNLRFNNYYLRLRLHLYFLSRGQRKFLGVELGAIRGTQLVPCNFALIVLSRVEFLIVWTPPNSLPPPHATLLRGFRHTAAVGARVLAARSL